jgi:dephospho-CoA kinase
VVFPTITFAIFFAIVLPTSWALMGRREAWKAFVLLASYVFYASADWRFAFMLAGITFGNQLFAKAIHASEDERRRKLLVRTAVVLDILVLGVFKYYGFFVQQTAAVLGDVGLGAPLPLMAIALPIGISFITFHAISYVVDVGRRQLEPPSLVDLALYISFFPHLVAGPIVRAAEFLPQLRKPRNPGQVAVGAAVTLITIGLFKKVVVADVLSREVVARGTDGLAEIEAAFGARVLTPEGDLDRPALAALVFADEDARRRLEAIVHPRVRARGAELEAAAAPGAVVVHDIPLLTETGQAGAFDAVLVVDVPVETQVRRLVGQRGMAPADAEARVAAQASREQRRAIATYVIDNTGTLEDLRDNVTEVFGKLVSASRSGS